jgi:hypothetical protein
LAQAVSREATGPETGRGTVAGAHRRGGGRRPSPGGFTNGGPHIATKDDGAFAIFQTAFGTETIDPDFTLLDQGALDIGFVGQDTLPAAVFPLQNVCLNLFDGEILMVELSREREFKGHRGDVAVDAHSGIRKVHVESTSLRARSTAAEKRRSSTGFSR